MTWEDDEPPHNLAAEQVVLGSMLMSGDAIREVSGILNEPDFYRPAHQVLYGVLTELHGKGDPHDPIACWELLRSRSEPSWRDATYLHTLIATVPTAANGAYYARMVKQASALRTLLEVGIRMQQRALGLHEDADAILADAEAELVRVAATFAPTVTATPIDQFDKLDLPYGGPVIPGVIHEQERMVVVADEGVGKSMLGLQAAVMTAAGQHVFTGEDIPWMRTLYVDLENPSATVQRRVRRIMRTAEDVSGWDPSRCWIWSKPGGLDVRTPADQRLLMTSVEKCAPSLLILGPLYKMTVDQGERPEQLHGTTTAFLDRIREQHGCALWLEAHAPLKQGSDRDMRPIGSGIWSRWPEFGLSLRKAQQPVGALTVGEFRGKREDRTWPVELHRGHYWPWVGKYPAGTF